MNFREYFPVFKATSKGLLAALPETLQKAGYKTVETDKKFIYAKGTIPVLLAAHIDTVHRGVPSNLFYDEVEQVVWSPTGCGADDRAGVAGILELIKRGFRPHVLFCDEEEMGCIGAEDAARFLPAPPVKYIIELDRNGRNDAVFYDCDVPEFEEYVTNFGFEEDTGVYSDISVLCPEWGIAGVNLSIGYYNAHKDTEYLRVNEWLATLSRVERMLKDAPQAPYFKYKAAKFSYNYTKTYKTTTYAWNKWDGYTTYYDDSFRSDYTNKATKDNTYGNAYTVYYANNMRHDTYHTEEEPELGGALSVDDLEVITEIPADWWEEYLKENSNKVEREVENALWDLAIRLSEDVAATGASKKRDQ